MISKARLNKIEEKTKQIEKGKYKYLFRGIEGFEEAKRNGLIDPNPSNGAPSALILDV